MRQDNLIDTVNTKQWIACQQCDALYERPQLKQGQNAKCTCCGSTLLERKVHWINRSFYWSIAGLLMLLPATLLPIMGVTLGGQYDDASLFECVMALIERGFYMIAILLFLFALAVPTVRLIGVFYLAYSFKFKRLRPSQLSFFRAFHHLDNWTMLNVFMLGIVVAMYKLVDDTELTVNLGLVTYTGWMICSTLAVQYLDQDEIWQTLEQRFGDK